MVHDQCAPDGTCLGEFAALAMPGMFHRLLSRQARLFTEMVTVPAYCLAIAMMDRRLYSERRRTIRQHLHSITGKRYSWRRRCSRQAR